MKIGETVIITKSGKYKNVVARLVNVKGNFAEVLVRGETHPITIHKDYIKGVRDEQTKMV